MSFLRIYARHTTPDVLLNYKKKAYINLLDAIAYMAAKLNYLTALLIAIVLISGCTNYGGNQTTPPTGANAVSIQNYAFSPSTLTVKAGTTVTWTNSDSVSHNIVSDSGVFESPSIANGQTYSYTFNTPGTFSYHCGIHPSMKASIIVQ